ncbi:MAG: hypothetical protein LBF81_05735, partial [Prevotellaceae bacterium]|nr:hypothetical protein [Prevotellaceae bacterium]
MLNKDYLPEKDSTFLSWVITFLGYLASILPRISFPESVYTELVALRDAFAQKLAIAEATATRTKTTVLEKNQAKKALRDRLRQAIGEYITRNHMVTDSDRDNLGLPIHKTKRDPAPVATTVPWVQVVLNLLRHLRFDFGGSEASKAKPEGQHGMELAARIGGEKPVNVHELTRSYFDTNSPLTIEFE